MSVTLRLARHGQKKRPFYRIVASPKGSKRDGRFIEILGTYDPLKKPAAITLKNDKVQKWIENGAELTRVVRSIVKKQIPGLVEGREKHQRDRIQAQRKARKARAATKAPKASTKKSKAAPKKK